ncbi:TPA: hypothetical protein I6187_003447 [Vibrio cholerae]|uniref:hypothetical protein n=1 Tax=Vibrio cholerae TaxID=666 RepID=UPI001A2F9210|nr:hypothetical protein [Vibrio cholerae]MDV2322871.1 hypothetical protein [Vibrio cholerae]HAS3638466.1 hypothetical protein [Vibrio cholerae]
MFGRKLNTDFSNKLQNLMSRQAKHQCMYPGCNNLSINSHSISKVSSLERIAEHGKLITVKSKRDDSRQFKEMKFELIGVNEASAFKGFCKQHDEVFRHIDNNNIMTHQDLLFQVYRSMCFFIFQYDQPKKVSYEMGTYKSSFDDEVENAKIINDMLVANDMYELLMDVERLKAELPSISEETYVLSPYFNDIVRNYKIIYKRLSFNFPVALEVKWDLKFRNVGILNSYAIYMPSSHGGDLIIVVHEKQVEDIQAMISSDLKTLEFLEYCLVSNSYFWAKPSSFELISEKKKNLILGDYWFFHERTFPSKYDVSIFDGVRYSLCTKLEDESLKMLEILKIDDIPKRKSFEERIESFMNNIGF